LQRLETRKAGGSRGIEAACARGFEDRGAHVVISYSRSEEQADAVLEAIRSFGGAADAVRADQSSPHEAVDLINAAADWIGHLDILVNNAAVATVGRIDAVFAQGELDRQLTVNYTSIVAAIRAAAKMMAPGGRIVNIGSVSQHEPAFLAWPTTLAARPPSRALRTEPPAI
jgi:3-oxoacyl-[acyl-carrier protein] reductase